MNQSLGQLQKVELRTIWTSESSDFTPWLARPENLKLLGDVVGIELELEATEKDVGPFSADILCKDTATGDWVVIENQLEKTNHTHLGQILTYGAGLKAATVIWIASQFTDEHRAALDWLNEISDERIVFLGLEVELWQIADSPVAPKFSMVSKPNEWSRDVVAGASRAKRGELSDAKKLQLRFWSAFRDSVLDTGSTLKPTKPLPHSRMGVGIGRSGFNLYAVASMWDSETNSYQHQEIRAELMISGNASKRYFAKLEEQKDEIESEFGQVMRWHSTEDARTCRIFARKTVNLYDEGDWPSQHTWLLERLERMKDAFAERIRGL